MPITLETNAKFQFVSILLPMFPLLAILMVIVQKKILAYANLVGKEPIAVSCIVMIAILALDLPTVCVQDPTIAHVIGMILWALIVIFSCALVILLKISVCAQATDRALTSILAHVKLIL